MVPCCGSYMAYMAYRSHQHHQPRGQECAEAFHAFDDSRKDGVVIIFVQVVCDGKEQVRTKTGSIEQDANMASTTLLTSTASTLNPSH